MRDNRRKVKTTLIVITTLLVCIGFGLLVSNLYLNSNLLLRKQSWNIHFENLIVKDGSVSTTVEEGAKIDSNNPSLITYSVAFDKPYDFYEFTVDVKNDGTVDTMVNSIDLKFNNQEIENSNLPSYIDYSVTYSDGVEIESKHILKAGSKENIRVRLYFENEITEEEFTSIPSEGISGYFTLQINYEQSDNTAISRNHNHSYYVSKILENTNNIEQVNISTTDHENELRFIGSNPNNYVIFNNEASCDANQENCTDVKWRIIGVFYGQLKLVRDSIGGYSWDTSGTDVNNGYGVNQWGPSTYTDTTPYTGSDLMKLLNPGYENNRDLQCNTTVTNTDSKFHCGDDTDAYFNSDVLVNNSLYWNGESGLCYNYGAYQTISCNFSLNGLTDTISRNMIEDATWYLGVNDKNTNLWINDSFNAQAVYTWERQNINLGKQCSSGNYCNDTVNRTPTWIGKVGLIYPSDYIYATSGGNTYDRDTCLRKSSGYSDGTTANWSNTYTDCYSNDWLYKSSYWQWLLSSRTFSSNAYRVFRIYSLGYVNDGYALSAGAVRPTIYIKSNVSISKGDGTQSNPYVLIS